MKEEVNRMERENEERKWYTANDILKIEGKETEWLWEKYIPSNAICGISGPSDTGKSTLLRQLSLSIASGEASFLGTRLNPKKRRVVYVSTEDSAVELKDNLFKQISSLGINEGALDNVIFLFEDGNVFDELESILSKYPVDLVLFDSMGDTFDGNANDFVSVRQYLRKLKFLCRKYNCSVLLLHHNVKNSEKGAPNKNNLNGSQGIEAKMRSLFELRLADNTDERLLTILKGNYVSQKDKNKSRVINFDEENLVYTNTDKEQNIGGNKSASKYDRDVWINRFSENGNGLSYLKTIDRLKEKFKEEGVPGKTWFIENMKHLGIESENQILEVKRSKENE